MGNDDTKTHADSNDMASDFAFTLHRLLQVEQDLGNRQNIRMRLRDLELNREQIIAWQGRPKMMTSWSWIGFITVVASVYVHPNQSKELPSIAVEVTVGKDARGEILNIGLANLADDIEVSIAHLPWSHWHSLTVVAVKSDTAAGIPIPIDPPIDDPDVGSLVIKSKETVKGTLPLSRLFSEWEKLRNDSDIVVFWTYRIRTTDDHFSNRVGGWIELKRRKN